MSINTWLYILGFYSSWHNNGLGYFPFRLGYWLVCQFPHLFRSSRSTEAFPWGLRGLCYLIDDSCANFQRIPLNVLILRWSVLSLLACGNRRVFLLCTHYIWIWTPNHSTSHVPLSSTSSITSLYSNPPYTQTNSSFYSDHVRPDSLLRRF